MIFDFPERLQRAIRIRASTDGVWPTELVASILERELAKELADADKALAREAKEGEQKPKK